MNEIQGNRRLMDTPRAKIKSISVTIAWTVAGIIFTAAVTMGMYQEKIANIVSDLKDDRIMMKENSKDVADLKERIRVVENAVIQVNRLGEKMEAMSTEIHNLALVVAKQQGSRRWFSDEKRNSETR